MKPNQVQILKIDNGMLVTVTTVREGQQYQNTRYVKDMEELTEFLKTLA
jgi:hypothetical protein